MEIRRAKDLTASVTINLARKITSGGQSDVYRGRLAVGGDGNSTYVAVKLPRYALAHVTEKIIRDVKNEIALWNNLEHPNVLPLLGTYLLNQAESLPGAVSPWCDDGTLIDYVKSAREGHAKPGDAPMTDGSLALLFLEVDLLSQATSGLEYLHGQNIIHGDLKGCNILVQDGIARLSDFGYSVLVAERLGSTSSHLGTLRWFAPEFLKEGARRTQEADVWALGCVFLEVQTLHIPYYGSTDYAVRAAIHADDWPYTYPVGMNMKLWRIAVQCWSWPRNRPTSQAISGRLKALFSSLQILKDSSVLSALPLTESLSTRLNFIMTLLWPALARISQCVGSDSTHELGRVEDVISALKGIGAQYLPHAGRRFARGIAITHPALAAQIMGNLSSPELGSQLRGHLYGVGSVAFLPDGRRIVSSSSDRILHIWDIERGKTGTSSLQGHSGAVRCAVRGSRIASCSSDGTLRVWDSDSGALVLGPITVYDEKRANCVAYAKDGRHIATAGQDNRAVLWDATTGVRVRQMVGHMAHVLCVAFSQDGTRLVSGSRDNTVRIWDVSSGECIGEPLTGHRAPVSALCFSPDDSRIFSSSEDGTIRIWDVRTRAVVFEPLQMDDRVLSLALSPDGKRLASGSRNGRIAMWDAETGAAIPSAFRGHVGPVWDVAFSPDGRKIASASEDKTTKLWDTTDDWKRYELSEDVKRLWNTLRNDITQSLTHENLAALTSLTSSDLGRDTLCGIHVEVGLTDSRPIELHLLASLSVLLARGGHATTHSPEPIVAARIVINVIDALELRVSPPDLRPVARALASHDSSLANELMQKLSSPRLEDSLRGHIHAVGSVAFLPDSRRIVSSSADSTLRIWDIKTGETVIGPLKEHSEAVPCVAVHGSCIASCSWDGTFHVWDANSGALVLGPITAHGSQIVEGIAYSRDGTRIATAGHDNRAAVWDSSTGVLLHEMVGHTSLVTCVAFSGDGTRLVSGSADRTIRVWNAVSGECIGNPLTGHVDRLRALSFSPDDTRVFSSSDDYTIRIWDAETKAHILEPLQMNDRVLCIALSPDGKRLVSGSRSGKIAMWDAEIGASIPMPFKNHTHAVLAVTFSPDGRTIASASRDGNIRLWDATDEWKRYDLDGETVEKVDD